MSNPLARVSLLLMVSFLAGADDSTPDEAERAKLAGTWKLASAEEAGQVIPPDRLKDQTLTLESTRYMVKLGEKVEEEGTFSVDPTASPRSIDLKIRKGADEGKTQPGIYLLDGDTLKIALARPGAQDRPTAFATSGDGAALFVMTLKRERR